LPGDQNACSERKRTPRERPVPICTKRKDRDHRETKELFTRSFGGDDRTSRVRRLNAQRRENDPLRLGTKVTFPYAGTRGGGRIFVRRLFAASRVEKTEEEGSLPKAVTEKQNQGERRLRRDPEQGKVDFLQLRGPAERGEVKEGGGNSSGMRFKDERHGDTSSAKEKGIRRNIPHQNSERK